MLSQLHFGIIDIYFAPSFISLLDQEADEGRPQVQGGEEAKDRQGGGGGRISNMLEVEFRKWKVPLHSSIEII